MDNNIKPNDLDNCFNQTSSDEHLRQDLLKLVRYEISHFLKKDPDKFYQNATGLPHTLDDLNIEDLKILKDYIRETYRNQPNWVFRDKKYWD